MKLLRKQQKRRKLRRRDLRQQLKRYYLEYKMNLLETPTIDYIGYACIGGDVLDESYKPTPYFLMLCRIKV